MPVLQKGPTGPAERALARIRGAGLTLTPQMFALWHSYYAGACPEVTRAIDILESSGQAVTDRRCAEIVERMESREAQAVASEAGQKVHETIETIGRAVTDMGSAAAHYKAQLNEATDAVRAPGLGAEDVKGVLQGLLAETQTMVESGAALEEVLAYSSDTIGALQRALTEARTEALTDALTGLPNRKAFDQRLAHLIAEAAGEAEPELAPGFCLILFDIDHFKAFNDTHGHQVGDHVLRLVSRALVDGIKGRDMAARYGGEEFAVLLPRTSATGGLTVAEALRRAVSDKDLVNRTTGERLGQVTLSAGVAAHRPGQDVEAIVRLADAALYAAKKQGRNRIMEAESA